MTDRELLRRSAPLARSPFVDEGHCKVWANQQYELPEALDLNRYSTMVVWCRAFSVGFTSAALEEL